MKLTIGQSYDRKTLAVIGWTDGDGSSSDGYNVSDYFDRHGAYLGPDQHGIEPLFSLSADPVTAD
jgi:hypothetical protein